MERKRGRPKTRCKNACQRDLKTTGLIADGQGDMMGKARKKEVVMSHSRTDIVISRAWSLYH